MQSPNQGVCFYPTTGGGCCSVAGGGGMWWAPMVLGLAVLGWITRRRRR
jgi:MYXO-CTERM domain-containing protein